jgi:hypothetical protein
LRYKGPIASEETKTRIRRELDEYSAQGAGLGELLEHLHARKGRLRRRERLSNDELDELSLHCWKLQRAKPSEQLWGKARELWGGTHAVRPRPKRRRHRSSVG